MLQPALNVSDRHCGLRGSDVLLIAVAIAIAGVLIVLSQGSVPSHKHPSRSLSAPQAFTHADIERLAQSGRRIEAIKAYRKLYGAGLKDAKEAVDSMNHR